MNQCIFECGDAGSAEHVVQAGLGGRRVDCGILCEACNSRFSGLDGELVEQLRPILSMVGARNSRTKAPHLTASEDPLTGAPLNVHGGAMLQTRLSVVDLPDGKKRIEGVGIRQADIDAYAHEVRASGAAIKREGLIVRGVAYVKSHPAVRLDIGGGNMLRAVARLALNVLAHLAPERARDRGLAAFKHFVRHGGDPSSFANIHYPTALSTLPEDSFRFQHRIVLLFDAQAGRAEAHVSLAGVVDVAVCFGSLDIDQSETWVHDVDVLAPPAPADVRTRRFPGILMRNGEPTNLAGVFADIRMQRLLAKRADAEWAIDEPHLAAALEEVGKIGPEGRSDRLAEALVPHEQRILNMIVAVVAKLRASAHAVPSAARRSEFLAALERYVAEDAAASCRLTDLGVAELQLVRLIIAKHLEQAMRIRSLSTSDVREVLEGQLGEVLVRNHIVSTLTAPRWLPGSHVTWIS